ncbi:MAG: DoxX family protein [Muribaculaceae bacterium]|nr:DoxX family protein [Muribaculaceae bacterium]
MNPLKRLYIRTTGYSYTNMGRLFLRLFVGLMMMQFGIRQLSDFDAAVAAFPDFLGLDHAFALTVMIIIEIGCSIFIMFGFLTRLMCLFPMLAMVAAEWHLLASGSTIPYLLTWEQLGYLPVMFIGIYFFIILVGPGKISVDYFLSLHIIHSDNYSEAELEEV